jgi:hypothetical protein
VLLLLCFYGCTSECICKVAGLMWAAISRCGPAPQPEPIRCCSYPPCQQPPTIICVCCYSSRAAAWPTAILIKLQGTASIAACVASWHICASVADG